MIESRISKRTSFVQFLREIMSLLLIISTLTFSSCAYSIKPDALPSTPEEFAMTYEELTKKYPDIKVMAELFNFKEVDPEEIVQVWGEPDNVKKDWWYFPAIAGMLGGFWLLGYQPVTIAITGGLAFLAMPVSTKKYVWIKENYCIEANVRTGLPRYQSSIVGWKWTDLREVEEPDSDCKLKSLEEGE